MKVITAEELELDNVDLKSLGTTTSPLIIEAPKQFQFQVVMSKALAAGVATAGLGSIGMLLFRDKEGTDPLFSHPIANTIDLKLDSSDPGGETEVVTFGATGAEISGSGTLGAGLGAVRIIPYLQLFFEVSEAVDVVATAVGDIQILMEGFKRS